MCRPKQNKHSHLSHSGQLRNTAGFTLLETLMAMMIMATALLLLANAWSASFSRVKKTQLNFELSTLLDRKMSELQREYQGKGTDEIKDEDEGDFGDDVKNFTWKMKSRKFEFPDITSSLTARSGGADQMTLMVVKQMTEHISKSIKEVTVTVTFKAEKQPIWVSATTYFTDFNKSISLGGVGP